MGGCQIALVRDIRTNEPVAVHRTALDSQGRKRAGIGSNGRLCLGPVAGGAVKLSPDEDVTAVLGIGEGLETAASLRRLPGLSELPVWSVLNANGIANFPVLPGIEAIWIAADNDNSGTGQRAADTLAERLTAVGVEAVIVATETVGTDLNDKVADHA